MHMMAAEGGLSVTLAWHRDGDGGAGPEATWISSEANDGEQDVKRWLNQLRETSEKAMTNTNQKGSSVAKVERAIRLAHHHW